MGQVGEASKSSTSTSKALKKFADKVHDVAASKANDEHPDFGFLWHGAGGLDFDQPKSRTIKAFGNLLQTSISTGSLNSG